MIHIADQVLSDLNTQLRKLDPGTGITLATAVQCYQVSIAAATELATHIGQHEFSSAEEEITFFKYHKPPIDARPLYYYALIQVLQQLPPIGRDAQIAVLHKELSRIQDFWNQHRELNLYFELEYDYLDPYYFRRSDQLFQFPMDSLQFIRDKKLFAPASAMIALFQAYQLLKDFLIERIEWGAGQPKADDAEADDFRWTGTQAEATEMLYAWNEMMVIGNKRHEISKLGRWFSKVFKFNVGNLYKTNENNRLRKKSTTPFLDKSKMALLRKYDYDDEHAL